MASILTYIRNNFFALTICVIWWFPVTYFGHWTAPVGTDVFRVLGFPLVAFALFAILLGRLNNINWRILLFLVVAMITSLNSADMVYSFAKFAGLIVIIGLLSPLIFSKRALLLREKLWTNLCWSAVIVVCLSVFWRVTGLPAPVLYVKQGFPGITSHAMLFGPVAGIAAVFILSKALANENRKILFLAIICYLAMFTSLSRAALASATMGAFVVIMLALKGSQVGKIVSILCPVIFVLVVMAILLPEDKIPKGLGFGEKNILVAKGKKNSREDLWKQRLEEFKEKPILGFGIGMSKKYEEAKVENSSSFSGTVEPGSAYLVILSMTGILGALTFVFFTGGEIVKFKKVWAFVPPRRKYELSGIGILLFVHAGAEGWIYSPGGVMCLYFWLWLGMVGDSYNSAKLIFPRKSGHVVKLLYAAVQSLQGTDSSKSNASVDDYRIFLCIQKCFSWPHPWFGKIRNKLTQFLKYERTIQPLHYRNSFPYYSYSEQTCVLLTGL